MGSATLTGEVVGRDGNYRGLPLIFDASDSNPIYGKSLTVTPLSQKVNFFLKF